jgi:hypothetical protein
VLEVFAAPAFIARLQIKIGDMARRGKAATKGQQAFKRLKS